MVRATKVSSGGKSIGLESNFPSDEAISGAEVRAFTLRLQKDLLHQVDEVVQHHPVLRNRNTWIVNAIVEQLKRERQA